MPIDADQIDLIIEKDGYWKDPQTEIDFHYWSFFAGATPLSAELEFYTEDESNQIIVKLEVVGKKEIDYSCSTE